MHQDAVAYTDAAGSSAAINNIIKNAREKLFLISPFLQVPEKLQGYLRDTVDGGSGYDVDSILIYGKTDPKFEESEWLHSLENLEIRWLKNLHAKCYLNERYALITSMNLYQFSAENNFEMGVLIDRNDDPEEYDAILKDVARLRRISEPMKFPRNKSETNAPPSKTEPVKKIVQQTEGHCIRCGEKIPFDMKNPYCKTCFKKWNRWKNHAYVEKTGCCMVCGRDFEASAASPICPGCIADNRMDSSLLE